MTFEPDISFPLDSGRELAQAFCASSAVQLARTGALPGLKAHLRRARRTESTALPVTYRQLFEAAYAHLWKHYRAEYVYKNILVRKILMGRHSLSTSRMFSEFRIGNAKADLLMVNGTTTIYEIKTALDSLDRLPSQLAAYCRAVDHVYVVTHPAMVDRVVAIVDRRIGIIALTNRGQLSVHRTSKSNLDRISSRVIFESLRRPEYLSAIATAFDEVPKVPNTQIHATCSHLFCSLRARDAHSLFVDALHQRSLTAELVQLAQRAPLALKALYLTTGLSQQHAVAFERQLDARAD